MPGRILPLVALWFCSLVTAPALRAADDAPKPDAAKTVEIAATDKAALEAAIGTDVVVTGTIQKAEWSATGKVMNIEFDDSELLAAVFEKSKDAVNAGFEGDAAKKWTGAKVKVRGKLEKYGGRTKRLEGRPQIVISKPDQVTIEGAAAAPKKE
jgi:hypothetical protein